jgi:hypothetical protein
MKRDGCGNGLTPQPPASSSERISDMDKELLARVVGSWKLVLFNVRDLVVNSVQKCVHLFRGIEWSGNLLFPGGIQ